MLEVLKIINKELNLVWKIQQRLSKIIMFILFLHKLKKTMSQI